eukprot:Skav218917  [mRNA]  locus=scaffold328:592897:596118:- [translate_table: standard]
MQRPAEIVFVKHEPGLHLNLPSQAKSCTQRARGAATTGDPLNLREGFRTCHTSEGRSRGHPGAEAASKGRRWLRRSREPQLTLTQLGAVHLRVDFDTLGFHGKCRRRICGSDLESGHGDFQALGQDGHVERIHQFQVLHSQVSCFDRRGPVRTAIFKTNFAQNRRAFATDLQSST